MFTENYWNIIFILKYKHTSISYSYKISMEVLIETEICALRYSSPVSGQGVFLWTLTQKSTFPNEFGGEMRATDKVIQKNQNTAKKSKIGYTVTKWRPKNQFPSRDIKFPTQNGKTTFPKEFFLEIRLIIVNSKYNYTAEIKFEKKLFGCAFKGKTNFEQRPKYAYLCLLAELAHGRWKFCCHQKKCKVKLD